MKMDLQKLDDIKMNFIIGTGRSGTTLMVALLNQYPDCIAAPEIHHFIFFYKKYKHITFVAKQVVSDYKNYLKSFFQAKEDPFFEPPDFSLLDSLEIGQKINYSQLTKLAYLSLFNKKRMSSEINLIVDKNPYYTLQTDKIFEIFPDAKILALIRDYRGFIVSNFQNKQFSGNIKSIFYYAHVWNLFIKKILKTKKNFCDKIMIVKYEDLVSNKEIVVKDIVNFFELKYNEKNFDFHLEVKEKISQLNPSLKNYERMLKKINELSVPVNSHKIYSWKDNLKISEIRKSEFICQEFGNQFGYLSETSKNIFLKILHSFQSAPSYFKVKIFEWMKSPDLSYYYKLKS